MIAFGQHGSELIHNAARDTGVLMFSLLAQYCFFYGIEGFAGDGLEQCSGSNLEGRAAGESTSERDCRVDERLEPRELISAPLKSGDNAAHVIGPGRLVALDWGADAEIGSFAGGHAVKGDMSI